VLEKTKDTGVEIIDCGLAEYRKILRLQHKLRERRSRGEIPNTILMVEHPPVITLGARRSANKVLANREELARRHIDVVEIRRGGGGTAHNPGQIVFYPILHLQELGLGVSEYIRNLEGIGIKLLRALRVHSTRRKGYPGLWVGDKKIASIGVRVSKFVTYHGMAINIQNDLSIFDLLIPCGLDGVEMTSVLKEGGICTAMNQVKAKLAQLLTNHFSDNELKLNRSFSASSEVREKPVTSHPAAKLPSWLRRPLPSSEALQRTEQVLKSQGLHTICSSANCPNKGECWSRGTATVLILGDVCTRNCRFCSVATGKPAPPDPTEPGRLAEMVKQLQLKYLVITSVNRDDLADGGAGHFRDCIMEVRKQCPAVKFEILTPDFRGCQSRAIETLRGAVPFVFAHNMETVAALYPLARAGASYQRSLNLLKMAKESGEGVQTKSSIMLGLGETDSEVEQVLKDLRNVGCDRITIGQYLKPSKNSLEVVEYVTPAKFDWWKQKAIELGFSWVCSSPFARSSYFAEQENTL